jgi:hypothetical protein
MLLSRLIRVVFAVTSLFALVACDANDLSDPPRPMGNFAMGLNIVVSDTAQTIPISRQVTPEQWKDALTSAMEQRFGSYSGDKLFDFGISIDGYLLAPPGVPLVASPKSALIITVNVWDDAKQQLLVKGGKRMTIMEGMSADSVIGSGWTQNKQAQMKKLAANAAKAVQDYMLEHPEWLGLPPAPTPSQTPSQAHANAPVAPVPKTPVTTPQTPVTTPLPIIRPQPNPIP